MKIGIFTFHRASNYGAVLQAYALQEYLSSQGYETCVVDYVPPVMGKLFCSMKVKGIYSKLKRLAVNIIYLPHILLRIKRRNLFRRFADTYLNLSRKILSDNDILDFDLFIIGSDQVWNVIFTGGVDRYYWGDFSTKKGAKKISYAASASENMNETFGSSSNIELLNNFDAISVREEELQSLLLERMQDKRIEKVLDPTLMAGREYFDNIKSKGFEVAKNYILVYQVIMSQNKAIQKFVADIAKRNDWEIIELPSSINFSKMLFRPNKYMQWASPIDFVTLFRNAKFVVTTSFHGTAFSLLYNVPFYVISISKSVDSRAADLLSQLGLSRRLIKLPQEEIDYDIDWASVNSKLDKLRLDSRKFLNDSISK